MSPSSDPVAKVRDLIDTWRNGRDERISPLYVPGLAAFVVEGLAADGLIEWAPPDVRELIG